MLSSIQKHARTLLCLTLLLMVSVVSACSQSNAQTNTASGNNLIVYVPGLNAHMSDQQTKENNGYGTDDSFFLNGDIAPYLQGNKDFKNARTLIFSYRGFTDDGKPGRDFCQDTYNNQLQHTAALLNLQITAYLQKHANTQVYLVSHSLGGVLTFAYLAQQAEIAHSAKLINGGILKAAAILDSPLGGVTGGSDFYNFLAKGLGTLCDFQLVNFNGIKDLQSLYATTNDIFHQGSSASILQMVYGQKNSNADVLSDLTNLGVNVLIVGNVNDVTWQPGVCDELLHNAMPNFLTTQYDLAVPNSQAKGIENVLSFRSGPADCLAAIPHTLNHMDVLTNGGVQTAIWETFLGKKTDVLTPVDNQSMPAGIPTPTPQPVLSPSHWTGQETTPGGDTYPTALVILTVNGDTFTGVWGIAGAGNSEEPFSDGKISANTITFSTAMQVPGSIFYTATVSGNQINGTWSVPGEESGSFSLTKVS